MDCEFLVLKASSPAELRPHSYCPVEFSQTQPNSALPKIFFLSLTQHDVLLSSGSLHAADSQPGVRQGEGMWEMEARGLAESLACTVWPALQQRRAWSQVSETLQFRKLQPFAATMHLSSSSDYSETEGREGSSVVCG